MFSIVMPTDSNRLEQFKVTKEVYDNFPQKKEFIIPTREYARVAKYIEDNELSTDVRLIPYKFDSGFNPSMALNMGVRNATYDNIIITSPEVKPTTDVLEQLSEHIGKNILCQTDDQDQYGNITPLVSDIFRNQNPAMYFLAMFNKSDLEKINGWDEEFMKGYAFEDNDFGERWMRAGLPFEYKDEIKATHQYHTRSETIPNGWTTNERHFNDNTARGVTYCENGLNKPSVK